MECPDKYEEICSPRFDRLDRSVGKILDLMMGDGNQPGFAERLRIVEAAQRAFVQVRKDWRALTMIVLGRVLTAAIIGGAGMFVGWLAAK